MHTYPPKRFAKSIASSREKLLSSPVKTNERPMRQSGWPSGMSLEPWATGAANFAAFTAAQLWIVSVQENALEEGTHLDFLGCSFDFSLPLLSVSFVVLAFFLGGGLAGFGIKSSSSSEAEA